MTTVILKYFGLNSSKHFHISTMGLKHNKGTSGKRFFVRGLFPALYISRIFLLEAVVVVVVVVGTVEVVEVEVVAVVDEVD